MTQVARTDRYTIEALELGPMENFIYLLHDHASNTAAMPYTAPSLSAIPAPKMMIRPTIVSLRWGLTFMITMALLSKPISITPKKIVIVLVSLLLMMGLHLFIRRTKWGMAMRAMAFDYVVVPLMGVSINTIAAMTFAIGSALAAAAGILFGVAYPVLDPYMGIVFGWKAFVAAILGGRGSVKGACLAGFLLGFIEIFVAAFFPSAIRDLIAFSIILVILTFRPHGFFGEPYSAKLRL